MLKHVKNSHASTKTKANRLAENAAKGPSDLQIRPGAKIHLIIRRPQIVGVSLLKASGMNA